MNKLLKKAIFGLSTAAMVVAPIAATTACGSSSSTTSIATVGKTLKADGIAPDAFKHFELPKNMPDAPANSHFEFSNDEYNFEAKDGEDVAATWTKSIHNFVMFPNYPNSFITFKVKLVPERGYKLSKPITFDLKYDVKNLVWTDSPIKVGDNVYRMSEEGGVNVYYTTEDKMKAAFNDYNNKHRRLVQEGASKKFLSLSDVMKILNTKKSYMTGAGDYRPYITPGLASSTSSLLGVRDTPSSWLDTKSGTYTYWNKYHDGKTVATLSHPGFFKGQQAPMTNAMPLEITEDNYFDIIGIHAVNPTQRPEEFRFHKFSPQADAKSSFDDMLLTLLAPSDPSELVSIDGVTYKAKYSNDKFNVAVTTEESDDIY